MLKHIKQRHFWDKGSVTIRVRQDNLGIKRKYLIPGDLSVKNSNCIFFKDFLTIQIYGWSEEGTIFERGWNLNATCLKHFVHLCYSSGTHLWGGECRGIEPTLTNSLLKYTLLVVTHLLVSEKSKVCICIKEKQRLLIWRKGK